MSIVLSCLAGGLLSPTTPRWIVPEALLRPCVLQGGRIDWHDEAITFCASAHTASHLRAPSEGWTVASQRERSLLCRHSKTVRIYDGCEECSM